MFGRFWWNPFVLSLDTADAQDYEQDSTYLLGNYAKLWTLPAPATCDALPRGCLEAHRRRPEAVVLGGLWEWHSGCLDCYLFRWLYWIVILRYSEASRYSGQMLISLSLLPAYKLPSARIGPWPITLQSMSNPHSQRVSCTKPTRNIVQQIIVFSMSCFLVVVWQRKPRNFSAGRQTSTWAPILWSPTDSFSFAPSKSWQLAARKGGHASVASVLGGHEETPWKDFDLNLRNPWQLGWPFKEAQASEDISSFFLIVFCLSLTNLFERPLLHRLCCWQRPDVLNQIQSIQSLVSCLRSKSESVKLISRVPPCSRLRIPRFGHGTCMMIKNSASASDGSTLYV